MSLVATRTLVKAPVQESSASLTVNDQALWTWAERDHNARLIVTDRLRICWANAAASEMLRQAGVLRHTAPIEIGDHACRKKLLQLVAISTSSPKTLHVLSEGGDALLFTAIHLGEGEQQRLTGLTVRCTNRPVPLDGTILATAFHLTTAEQRVVELLTAGKTAEDVAAQLGVCLSTVRAHVRHVYDKLGVGSREAMFQRALQFAPAL